MNIQNTTHTVSGAGTNVELLVREDLAALYHIFSDRGWCEHIYNHITARVPGPDKQFLINSFGLTYDEVTASNLIKIDLDGNKVIDVPGRVNKAGFVIHSAIHAAREDVHFIAHTHTTAGVAVACSDRGLCHDSFYGAMLYEQVAYHEFEGISTDLGERDRLVTALGEKNYMIMRHHGLLACGSTAAEALFRMSILQRACEIQLAAATFGKDWRPLSEEVLRRTARQLRSEIAKGFDDNVAFGEDAFAAYRRSLDARGARYRD
ncbi:class II aldolase/adducin family protein [Bradyrhizobium sp. CCBAU 51627]|uniref:class II aldolase/adducin family protein n=1 Tax=Bradyrhizobium sp. CCBAU 51627 TaxID=1325088 RepID=UPI002305EFEF|nr:class II aldolase/adducin family protein [Bradyrhizobium sp. CCBAU 51627]MDA9433818.1 ribulose-phosphate 3-epimerase [Bradyrhizobium sp. CCBAU 51627]